MSDTGNRPLAIRSAGPDDIDAIQRIYAHHVLHGSASFEEVPPDVAELERRRRDVVARGLPYLVALKDDAGAVHGGNLTTWPDEQRDDRSWEEFTVTRDDGPSRAKGLQALLPDGSIALVATDLSARDRIRHASLAGFAVALMLATAFAMAAGAGRTGASAMPLAPNGPSGAGTSSQCVSIGGSIEARGSA